MRHYELICLFSPELNENNLKELIQKINNFLQEKGAILDDAKNPVKKRLGSPIKKKESSSTADTASSATLVSFSFHLEPQNIEAIEKKLKPEAKILRYMLLIKKIAKRAAKPRRKIAASLSQLPAEKGTSKETTPDQELLKKPSDKEKTETTPAGKEKKVELKEIGEKLEEILDR